MFIIKISRDTNDSVISFVTGQPGSLKFHSRKGYTIRYEVILAISISIIMVIEMSSFEIR